MSKYDINRFKHVTVALNTPFASDGSVDVEAVKAVSRYFRDKGIKQMYVCGSTGEGFLLDTEERKLVTETVVNEVGRDMNIIVHPEDYNTHCRSLQVNLMHTMDTE